MAPIHASKSITRTDAVPGSHTASVDVFVARGDARGLAEVPHGRFGRQTVGAGLGSS
ncbi:hypothetical protein ThimaDRAFT_2246 [Thiocapsa marina 5811]|uniref:Uncharacterized protein n=1 Tax=Thiocapsa marina 5811 TaxID=768671 RepID=F9UBE4_9GAMM|nr:hypothetical protein ThimaDRAFT_2246 [Thiocapsa marina 5811]